MMVLAGLIILATIAAVLYERRRAQWRPSDRVKYYRSTRGEQ